MSIEFDLARAIILAVNTASRAGAFNLPVTARLNVDGSLELEKESGVIVWVLPNASDERTATLDESNENLVTVNVIVGRNLDQGTPEEVEAMLELTELIGNEITARIDNNTYDWLRTDKNPLWDTDSIGLGVFHAERLMDFRVMS